MWFHPLKMFEFEYIDWNICHKDSAVSESMKFLCGLQGFMKNYVTYFEAWMGGGKSKHNKQTVFLCKNANPFNINSFRTHLMIFTQCYAILTCWPLCIKFSLVRWITYYTLSYSLYISKQRLTIHQKTLPIITKNCSSAKREPGDPLNKNMSYYPLIFKIGIPISERDGCYIQMRSRIFTNWAMTLVLLDAVTTCYQLMCYLDQGKTASNEWTYVNLLQPFAPLKHIGTLDVNMYSNVLKCWKSFLYKAVMWPLFFEFMLIHMVLMNEPSDGQTALTCINIILKLQHVVVWHLKQNYKQPISSGQAQFAINSLETPNDTISESVTFNCDVEVNL